MEDNVRQLPPFDVRSGTNGHPNRHGSELCLAIRFDPVLRLQWVLDIYGQCPDRLIVRLCAYKLPASALALTHHRSPFLANVTDITSFDTQLQQYIANSFPQQRYQELIGCSAYNASNTTNYYARYTTSVLCNSIVQNSIDACNLTGTAARPLCADTCVS